MKLSAAQLALQVCEDMIENLRFNVGEHKKRLMSSERSHMYEQLTGELLDETNNPIATGYAGREAGKNNPDMQNVKGIGPLPRGWYTAQEPKDHPTVGKYAMQLIPDASNEMYGRNSFFMHGDAVEHPGLASHGCIVMPRCIRELFWKMSTHRIQVTHG